MDLTEQAQTARGAPARARSGDRASGRGGVPGGTGGDGLVLGRYRLERRLGHGGCGTVWRALDERLGREVAVKVIPREGGPGAKRGLREAQAAARLSHPAIVTLYEAGDDKENHYLVSELVHGATLRELLDRGALSDRDILRIGLALCAALGHAHGRGVIHRDMKPGNVMVPMEAEPGSGTAVAKLTDFGVAHLAGDDLTRTGDVLGTIAYMAPEQAAGRRVTAAADLYALALVLYEALAGVNPVKAAAPLQTARRVGNVLPPLLRQRPDLPPELCTAIDRAVLPSPGERGSVAELGAALGAAAPHVSDEPGVVLDSRLDALRDVPRAGGRVPAGLLAGGIVLAATATLGATPPLPPAALAAIAAALVMVLPRLGWLAAMLATLVWLTTGAADLAGIATLGLLALLPVPLLLPRAGRAWSVPAVAPALGAISCAAAYPALAGQARTPRARIALGALGAWWLLLCEPVVRAALFLGDAHGTWPRAAWEDTPGRALRHALWPQVTSGALSLCVVWGIAALVLPWLVRGRSAPLDIVGATVWTAGLAAATSGLGRVLDGAVAHPRPAGALPVTIAAGVLVVLLRGARGPVPEGADVGTVP